MPVLVPELAERCIVVNAVSKSYAMTGWRVGWSIAPLELTEAAIRIQSHLSTNVANVSQMAALAAVAGGLEAVAEMREVFDRRRRTMVRMLNELPGVTCIEPHGAFYAFPSMAGLLGRRIGERTVASTIELAAAVLDDALVAFVPGEAFGAPGYARFSFALGDSDLVEGLERMASLLAAVEV